MRPGEPPTEESSEKLFYDLFFSRIESSAEKLQLYFKNSKVIFKYLSSKNLKLSKNYANNFMEVLVSILFGKCLCNKVSYSYNAEPTAIFHCNCKDCYKATRSVFRSNLFFS